MADFFQTGLGIAVLIAGQSLLVIGFVMISLLFLVYGDRKIWAAVQMRKGPNVVGAFGLLQTVADALKYVVKEIVVPAGAIERAEISCMSSCLFTSSTSFSSFIVYII